jgi:diguanylate cyclase (GGDEF)-like protein
MKQSKIQVLQQKIDQIQDPLEKVKQLNELALVLEDSNLSYAIRVVDEAVVLSQSLDESQPDVAAVVANSLFTRGLLNLETTNFELTISSIYQALPLINQINDDSLKGRALEVLAKANFALDNVPEGFEFSWQALSFYETLSDRRWVAGLYNLVGRQYLDMGQLEWAERYFQQAFDQMEGLPINKTHADIQLNQSLLNTRTGDFEQAERLVHTAIKIYQKFDANDKLTKALVTHAQVHETLKDYESALENLNQALQISEEYGLLYRKVRVLSEIGQIALEKKDYDSAFSNLQAALKLSDQLNIRHEAIRIHRSLARGYKQVGSLNKSLDHFESFYRYEKQIEKEQDVQRIRSLEIMHQVGQTQKGSQLMGHESRNLREQLKLERTSQSPTPTQITDPLTGLLNRKHFFTILEKDHLNVEHYGKVISMIMMDVDQFRKVNQENGNLIADQMLLDLAHLIRDEFRPRDLVWRISGQEFVILLPNTDCKDAQILAEKLLQQVREHTFLVNGKKIQITISQGVACTGADQEKRVDMLLEHANKAWSIAKQQGGNQVVIWRSPNPKDEH